MRGKLLPNLAVSIGLALGAGCSYGIAENGIAETGILQHSSTPRMSERMVLPTSATTPNKQLPLVYVSDVDDGDVAVFDRSGKEVRVIDGLTGPTGIFVNRAGTLYVVAYPNRIRVYPHGDPNRGSVLIGTVNPRDVSECPNGKVYVSTFGTGSTPGQIDVYAPHATSPSDQLVDANAQKFDSVTCDYRGNVFASAVTASGSNHTDVYIGGRQVGLRNAGIAVAGRAGIKPYPNHAGHMLVGDSVPDTITDWDCSTLPCKATNNQIHTDPQGGLDAIAVTQDGKTVLAVQPNYSQAESYSFPSGTQLFTYYVYSYSSLAYVVDGAYEPGQTGQ